ncbi:helix-turn-helix transcriptional regulator [Janibacter sp. GS2]|uniref:helix-turn-helix transcriptional regulator n=1 Tax=Janibacter sp. GS2 TaxID=3442646 RepID=UPI003EC063DA
MKVTDKEALRRARKRAKYSQRDLAALCRCTQATISALETGTMPNCSDDLAEQIAKWLDRDVEDLFERMRSSRVHRVTNARGITRQKMSA